MFHRDLGPHKNKVPEMCSISHNVHSALYFPFDLNKAIKDHNMCTSNNSYYKQNPDILIAQLVKLPEKL